MAANRKKDAEDKNGLNTSPKAEEQGNHDFAPGMSPEGEGQNNEDPGKGTSPEGEEQGNHDFAPGMSPEGEGQNNEDPGKGTSPEGEGQGNHDSAPGTPPEAEGRSNSDADPDELPGAENTVIYEITCRNKINKTIGGVTFMDGVGHTEDGYAASWFGNKEGYWVSKFKK